MCFRVGKAPTRRNLGAASLISFVIMMVAKVYVDQRRIDKPGDNHRNKSTGEERVTVLCKRHRTLMHFPCTAGELLNDRSFRQVNVIFWRLHRAKMLEGAFSVQFSRPARPFRAPEACSWTIIVVVVFHAAIRPVYVSDTIHSLLSPC